MFWIIFTVLVVLILVGCVIGYRKGKQIEAPPKADNGFNQQTDYGKHVRYWSLGVFGGVAVLWLVLTIALSAIQVPAGHEGVQYTFGKITGTVPAGFHLIVPWSSVTNANTQVQAHQFDSLTSFSKETQDVNVSATINYSVNPKDVKRLYTTVGPDWFSKLVETRVNQFFKDETVKFTAVDIAPNRDQIRQDVRARLRQALAPYSINVEDLLIDNLTFSKGFTQSIEDKQIATQQAQAAQNRVATARYQAQQLIATAKGQAAAQRLRRQTLTPLLVEQNAIDKLNPNVQVIMVPAGSNFLLPNLLNATSKP